MWYDGVSPGLTDGLNSNTERVGYETNERRYFRNRTGFLDDTKSDPSRVVPERSLRLSYVEKGEVTKNEGKRNV